jgi:hypothetical protein
MFAWVVIEPMKFASPKVPHEGEGKDGGLILRKPITAVDVTPRLRLVG